MVAKRRMLMLCGLSYSGKTTLAEVIERRLGWQRLCLDDINTERGLPAGGTGLPVEEWATTLRIGLDRLDRFMGDGHDVVVDDTCCFRWLRDDYRQVARRHGYQDLLVILDTPLAVIRERRHRVRVSGERTEILDEVFESHRAGFEWPGDDELALVFHHTDDAEQWVARYLKND